MNDVLLALGLGLLVAALMILWGRNAPSESDYYDNEWF